MISTYVNASRSGLAVLLLSLAVVPTFSQAQSIPSTLGLAITTERNGAVYSCGPDTCALPAPGGNLPIPFPNITMSVGTGLVQDGQLRGHASIVGNGGDQPGSFKGGVSMNTKVVAYMTQGSFTVLSESMPATRLLSLSIGNSNIVPGALSPSQTTVIVLTSRAHAEMSATTNEDDCPHSEHCRPSAATARASVFIGSEQNADGSPDNETQADTDWIRQSNSATLLDSYRLSIPFAEEFDIGWSFDFSLNASPQGAAAVDFSSTVGFTGIGFYAADGFDLTPYMSWSFDGGLQIPGIAVTTPVPEPETYAMLLAGLALLGVATRRRKRNA